MRLHETADSKAEKRLASGGLGLCGCSDFVNIFGFRVGVDRST